MDHNIQPVILYSSRIKENDPPDVRMDIRMTLMLCLVLNFTGHNDILDFVSSRCEIFLAYFSIYKKTNNFWLFVVTFTQPFSESKMKCLPHN